MVDVYLDRHNSQNNAGSLDSYHKSLPPVAGQDVDYARPMMVASPASCAPPLPSIPITMAVPIGAGIPPTIRILRLPDVIGRVGICRASIYQHMETGTFPKQISLGARAVGWLEYEIDAWLAARVSARITARDGSK